MVAVALVITCLSVLCCYWAQLATKGAQQEAKRSRERYDVELDFYGANHIAGSKEAEEDSETSSSSEESDSEAANRPKMIRKNGSAVKKNDNSNKSNKPVVPQLKVNGIVETSSNGHVLNKSESLPNGDVGSNHISGTSTPILDRAAVGAQDKGAGYQASLRHLLTTQQSEPAMSRPTSAFFISNSRPNSSELLNPRQRPLSATGRPVGFVGPYVSDSSRLKGPGRPRPPRPPILGGRKGGVGGERGVGRGGRGGGGGVEKTEGEGHCREW